jgi:hypothetical protein
MERPADDAEVGIDEALAWQAAFCRSQAAPVTAALLDAVRDGRVDDERLAGMLPDRTRFGDLVGLRLLAVLHRLALERRAPALALHLPTLGGSDPFVARDPARAVASLRAAALRALQEHPGELAEGLGRVPQTNEVGRSRPLRIALRRMRGPVRLVEIGASAGLNLRADRLTPDPDEAQGPLPEVVERLGCDLHPVDPDTPEGRATLSSYVWVDDVDRFRRLAQALEVAGRVPATVVARDAASFVAELTLRPGTTTVVWHSAVWGYLGPADRDRIGRRLASLGAGARPGTELCHVAWEPWDDSAEHRLTVRVWDGTAHDPPTRVLATGSPHGREVTLREPG